MPEIVREPVEFPRRGKFGAIDWSRLTDGKTYRLVSGKDFSGETLSVQSSAHQAATRRGLRVRTTTQGSDVIVQFYDPKKLVGRPQKPASQRNEKSSSFDGHQVEGESQ